ncbi:hypothetical protein AB205_0160000 [Aquarana catesbeiana]|uniref:Uncharacterized protein n=1 Tax=Aquarana catesbeiana TaxID=8400 RepID=A0A2G9S501_AQUCT|nr:hypothetical protein AB205_0160000 [Aquarana catesbeiana]
MCPYLATGCLGQQMRPCDSMCCHPRPETRPVSPLVACGTSPVCSCSAGLTSPAETGMLIGFSRSSWYLNAEEFLLIIRQSRGLDDGALLLGCHLAPMPGRASGHFIFSDWQHTLKPLKELIACFFYVVTNKVRYLILCSWRHSFPFSDVTVMWMGP